MGAYRQKITAGNAHFSDFMLKTSIILRNFWQNIPPYSPPLCSDDSEENQECRRISAVNQSLSDKQEHYL